MAISINGGRWIRALMTNTFETLNITWRDANVLWFPPGCFSPHAESWTIPLVDHHVPHYGGLYWPFLDPSCREASKYSSVYPTDIHVYAIIYVHVIYELACLYPFYNHVVIRKVLGSRTQLIHIDLGSPWFLSGGCWFNGGWDYIVVSLYHYIYTYHL